MKLRERGFTIIEVMVVIVILGIVLAIGIPSFRELIINFQIRGLSESVLNGLQLARSTAVQRNENIEFTLPAVSGSYTRAWSIQAAATPGTPIQSKPAGDSPNTLILGVLPNAATTVTFNGMGRVVANTDGSNSITTIDIDVSNTVLSAAQSADLRVRILPGGLIKLCNPNVSDVNDVRKCP